MNKQIERTPYMIKITSLSTLALILLCTHQLNGMGELFVGSFAAGAGQTLGQQVAAPIGNAIGNDLVKVYEAGKEIVDEAIEFAILNPQQKEAPRKRPHSLDDSDQAEEPAPKKRRIDSPIRLIARAFIVPEIAYLLHK
jgi:hypothetical protein